MAQRRSPGGRPERGGRGRGGQGAGRGSERSGDSGAGSSATGSTPLVPRGTRLPDPAIAEGVTGKELDRAVIAQLRTLSKENAEGVAQHLVMVALLLETDPRAALAHAETAARRAGRVAAVREALGLVAYRIGDWSRALNEFRTVRRLSGSDHLIALMVDCERALGRPARALELAGSAYIGSLAAEDQVELAIVVSGIRRDLGQADAALAVLSIPALRRPGIAPWSARLYYAYAEAQLGLGRADLAREWFARAVAVDPDATTDAAERLDALDGIELIDLDDIQLDDLN